MGAGGLGGEGEHKQRNEDHKQPISPGQRLPGMGREGILTGVGGKWRRRPQSALDPAGGLIPGGWVGVGGVQSAWGMLLLQSPSLERR